MENLTRTYSVFVQTTRRHTSPTLVSGKAPSHIPSNWTEVLLEVRDWLQVLHDRDDVHQQPSHTGILSNILLLPTDLQVRLFTVILSVIFYPRTRRSLWTQPTIRRLSLACMFLTVSMLVWLVPFSYELHGLARSLSPWVSLLHNSLKVISLLQDFHYEMPTWILKFYEISYFFTILGPSFYPIIFNGKELLSFSSQVMTRLKVLDSRTYHSRRFKGTTIR